MRENGIPSGWSKKSLRDIVCINYGRDPSEILDPYGAYPVHGTADNGRYGTTYLYDGDSVILGRKGTIDRVKFATGSFWTIDTAYFLSDFADCCPKWLYYFLCQLDLRSMNEATGVPSLSRDLLYNIPVLVPPTAEQSKIAEVLSTVDRAIERTEALITKQQRIKTGLMQDLLTRGIDEHGNIRSEATHEFKDSPIGRIPVEWDTFTIDGSDIAIIDGDRGKHYPHADELIEDGHCLFLSAANVTKRGFDFESTQFITKEKDEKLRAGKLCRGDVIITTRGTVGNIAYYDDGVRFSDMRINSGMVILRSNQAGLSKEFFYTALQNYVFDHEYKRVVSGSAQPQLPVRDIKRFNVLVPGPEEQMRIVHYTAALQACLVSEEDTLVKMRFLKTGLMQDLLTGDRRVTALLSEEKAVTV